MARQIARIKQNALMNCGLYEKAIAALRIARDTDEVRDLRDKAIVLEAYAKQAKDPRAIAYATEIKLRAERRLGEVMAASPKAKGGAQKGVGRKGKKAGGGTHPEITLDDVGIGKRLADRARKTAALPEREFEARVSAASAKASAAGAAVFKQADKAENRAAHEKRLAAKIEALPDAKFGLIVADPEWEYETYSEQGMDRSASNHFPTSVLDEIKRRDVRSIAADDCILFLWATVPFLKDALDVMAAWGFTYKSSYVWTKSNSTTGHWNLNQHEYLLVGTRGKPPAPLNGADWGSSIIRAPTGRHSAKPEVVLEKIEKIWPDLPKIELNRRGEARPGWHAWGADVDADD